MRTMAELIPGFEYRTIHDLRHTYASLLILGGTHSKVIQQHLGHSSTRVTDDIYGHLIEDASSQGRDAIEQLMADLNAQTLELVSDQTLTPQTAA